ncbi:hypothetical protein EI94DRAFT_1820143 [Lactarius quietus]|nr:hypothetical protein EI94DRAFT_1820143 [Lactarius quietus]
MAISQTPPVGSASIIGITSLENARQDSDSDQTKAIIFDAQFYLAPGSTAANITKYGSSATVRATELEPEDYHFVGDIVWLVPAEVEDACIPAYVHATGTATAVDTSTATFHVNSYQPQNLPSSYSLTHWDEFRSTTTHNSLVTSTAHDWRREPDAQGFKHQRDDPDLDFEAECEVMIVARTVDNTDSEYFVAHIGATNVHSIAILAALGFNVVWIFAVFDEVGMRIVDPWDMS